MFSKNKKYIILAVIIAAALITVYLSAINRNNTRFADSVVGAVVEPVSSFFGGIARGTSDFFEYFANKKELISENREMDEKILKLEEENSQLKAYENENERLRAMLEFKDKNPQFSLTAAEVVSKDTSNYYSVFLMNKGTEAGIEVNMPVVGSKGLVGYVIESGKGFARVRTILDGRSSAGCVITRTQSTAVTEGDTTLINEGLIKMIYVSKDMNIIKGDVVETSGMGQIYPSGIVIGRIEEIKEYSGSESQYALIKPVEDFNSIYEVFVITDYQKAGGNPDE